VAGLNQEIVRRFKPKTLTVAQMNVKIIEEEFADVG
jgi:hypothetical protein